MPPAASCRRSSCSRAACRWRRCPRPPASPPALPQFADRIHAAGGFVSSQFVLQGGMPLAPSPTLSGYYDHRVLHPMDLDEIALLVTEYGESAALAAAAGID